MRILILSHYYDPEPIPKPSELARELIRRGHEVFVVTGFPNYPAGVLYPGFRPALFRREERDGVTVLRTFQFPYHGHSSLGRVLNYASFMFSSLLGIFLAPPCDVIYVWHPPLSVGIAAMVFSLVKKAPFVYDVQDIWPESIVLAGWRVPPVMFHILEWLERAIYKFADRIIVVTPGAKNNLVKKGVNGDKINVAPHWVDAAMFLQEDYADHDIRSRYGIGSRFMSVFAGNIGLMQGLETLIHAATRLRHQENIVFVLIGDGVEREHLKSMAQSLALENVLFVEKQPMSEMPFFLSTADALLVLLRESELSECIIPTKTIAYLAAAKPIIAAVNGACADLIREADAGIVVLPNDPDGLAEGVLRLYEMSDSARRSMGLNGRAYFLNHFAREKVVRKYEEILSLVGHKSKEVGA